MRGIIIRKALRLESLKDYILHVPEMSDVRHLRVESCVLVKGECVGIRIGYAACEV